MKNRHLFLLLIALIAAGCKSSGPSRSTNETSYDFETSPLHPDLLFYHVSDDSTKLYLQVYTDELLFTRQSPDAPFTSNLSIDLFFTSTKDTVQFGQTIVAEEDLRKVMITQVIPFKKQPKTQCIVRIRDENRKWEERIDVVIEKTDSPTRQDFLLMRVGSKNPFFGYNIAQGSAVDIQSARFPCVLNINHWTPDIHLPPPPYSEAKITLPDEKEFDGKLLVGNTQNIESGIYSVYCDSSFVFSIFGRESAYPRIKTVAGMVNSLRYISSRKEYERIQGSNYPKVGLDEFWIDCGGSKDKARSLIKNYYRRVVEANRSFSSYAEGWKTDRGLVHVVFGNPNKIKKSADTETWIYGEENNVSSVSFTFAKISTKHSDNEFRLIRNPLYRSYWDRAVTAWRNGRVFLD
jgi:GWxTD domain-containing protein